MEGSSGRMEPAPAQRRCCLRLLRLRQNCRKQTHGASSSPVSSRNCGSHATCQPIRAVYSQPRPPQRSRSGPDQGLHPDVHMEEVLPASVNPRRDLPDGADASMELDDDVDPETGERAQG
ncbi:uncharacterized protein ACB058_020122 [Synchiropus picturatus]